MIFISSKSLQECMIEDFILEYKQQKKIGNIARMAVIISSINELREQIKNLERHSKMIYGGYSDEEMQRINSLPRNLNGV